MKPKDSLILFIKGFILGIANIIPGVSGGTLAVSLGLYEKILDAIGTLFKNFKNNVKFLTPIILGIVVSILSTSKLVSYALANFKAQTVFLFVGLIFGGTSLLMRKIILYFFSDIGYNQLRCAGAHIISPVIFITNGGMIHVSFSNRNVKEGQSWSLCSWSVQHQQS